MKKKVYIKKFIQYTFLIILGLVIIYPLLWLFFSSFKVDNEEIFGSLNLIPAKWTLDGYINGFKGSGQYGFDLFFLNTFILVVPTVFFTIISSTIVAYGFARFEFPLKKILFSLMLATLMLPNAVVIIPRYILFNYFKWIDTYYPFIVPAAFAGSAFFVFMMVQFLRGIPIELDESAKIDGCNSFVILLRILLPLCKPALFSMGIFQFIWTWNDFFNPMIFINSTYKFTVSLALRMTQDTATIVIWNQVLAMSVLTLVPCIFIFFISQKYFVEGIATTGLKA
ncbi:MAG: carbohydrate ABC transporter permease [Spirochaetales bacterium]|nr:carbohydrate ABC transporter permease [Spirochaetales bacterium]